MYYDNSSRFLTMQLFVIQLLEESKGRRAFHFRWGLRLLLSVIPLNLRPVGEHSISDGDCDSYPCFLSSLLCW